MKQRFAKLEVVVDVDEFTPQELETIFKRELEADMFQVLSVKYLHELTNSEVSLIIPPQKNNSKNTY